MNAYTYDPETFEFKYISYAYPDPIDGHPVLPGNSTFKEPPEAELGKAIIFNIKKDKWQKEIDHRGHYQVNTNKDEIEFTVVNYIGKACPGYQFVEDEVVQIYWQDLDRYAIIDGQFVDLIDTPEYLEKKLQNAKTDKLQENTSKRDSVLLGGVEYKGILFDSDTDQKLNLREARDSMSDIDIVTWYGMNGTDSLECTKDDLTAIGQLIFQLTTFVWSRNAEIETAINVATTIAQVESVRIDYEMT